MNAAEPAGLMAEHMFSGEIWLIVESEGWAVVFYGGGKDPIKMPYHSHFYGGKDVGVSNLEECRTYFNIRSLTCKPQEGNVSQST